MISTFLGVSVHHLANDFINEVHVKFPDSPEDTKIYEIEDLNKLDSNGIVQEKGKDTACPIDGRQGAAYVHTLQGADRVGPASIMPSYTWGYTIGVIVDVLNNYCTTNNLNPKEVYVWICFLCVNQHRVIEKKRKGEVVSFEEFRSIFFKRVTNIGQIHNNYAHFIIHTFLSIFHSIGRNRNICSECGVYLSYSLPLRMIVVK